MASGKLSHHQQGATLLEVLITVLILAIGLLGVAAMQMMALRNSQQSLQQSLATIYSYSILDSMRANADAARAGEYDVSDLCSAPPSAATLVPKDQAFWINAIQAQLGEGACGSIDCQASGECAATVTWSDGRGVSEGGEVTTRAQL